MNVFITGATGYIGGSIAQRMLTEGHVVRGLARSEDKAFALAERGIEPVLGNLDDSKLLALEAGKADVVINAASTLHLAAAQALVLGVRSASRILHTSGIGAYSHDEQGELGLHAMIDDISLPKVGPHPSQQQLRAVEQVFLQAAGLGKHAVVLSNALIYGDGLGISRDSTQLPLMARMAIQNGHVTVVGAGENCWSTVHISDVVELYMLALAAAPPGAFYFVENGVESFATLGRALADRLNLGEPHFLALDDAASVYGEMAARYLLGTSSRVRATRARQELGWRPTHRSALDWIASELTV